MTETIWAPPPPPKKRRRWPYIVAIGAVGIGIGGALASPKDEPPATVITAPDTTERRTTTTVDTMSKFDRWLADHGDQLGEFADRISTISTDIAAEAYEGNEAVLMAVCFDALTYTSSIEDADFVTEGPAVFINAVDAYDRSFTACAAGDFEAATRWTEEGTALITELTDLINE